MGLPARGRLLVDATRGGRLPWAILAVTTALVLAGSFGLRAAVDAREQSRLANSVNSTRDRIATRLETYEALLVATRAMIDARGGHVDAEQFQTFVAELDLQRAYPGIQGIAFTRKVPPDHDAFVREVVASGVPGFRLWPDHPNAERQAIVFIAPLDRRNRTALGYDMWSEPVRREAMIRARDGGAAAASGPVTLVQEIDEDKQAGFLLYVPVYRGGGTPATLEARREAFDGLVSTPFRADDLFRGIFGTETPRVGFELFDAEQPETILHRYGTPPARGALRADASLEVAGRTWQMRLWTLPAFEKGSSRIFWPWLLGAGGVVSILLFVLLRTQERAADERAALLARERSLRAEAEAASRTKDEFLAMLGHELRNPLAPITTALSLLARRRTEGEDRELAVIERQVTHLKRLVDDLLDVSAITRGKVKLTRRRLDVCEVVNAAVEIVRPLVDENRHDLRVECASGLHFVEGDESRLVQVLANLLTNAAKYTPPGGHIGIVAARDGDAVLVRVVDDGQGIARDDLGRLFEIFEQGERTADRRQGGLGIGLAVVKSLVELHGGSVEARSEGAGTGTEMRVRLPAATGAGASPDRVDPDRDARVSRATERRRILVVDDNEDGAFMLSELVAVAGHDVDVAHDGPSALERAGATAYDVAIVDIGLPGIDGYEVARRIRKMQNGPRTLVALTGYGQERDKKLAYEAGFDHHLVKPVDVAKLLALVSA